MRVAWTLVLILATAGCTASTPPPPASPSPSATAGPILTSGPGVRDCATAVQVGSGDDALRVGAVTLVPLDYHFGTAIDQSRSADAEGYYPFKIAVRLPFGAAATVTIPSAYRDRVKLTYLPGSDHAVTFIACGSTGDDGHSDFAGGFAVRGPVCLPVDIASAGRTDRLRLEFGTRVCR